MFFKTSFYTVHQHFYLFIDIKRKLILGLNPRQVSIVKTGVYLKINTTKEIITKEQNLFDY